MYKKKQKKNALRSPKKKTNDGCIAVSLLVLMEVMQNVCCGIAGGGAYCSTAGDNACCTIAGAGKVVVLHAAAQPVLLEVLLVHAACSTTYRSGVCACCSPGGTSRSDGDAC
jgi:hypothetical protein